MTRKINIELKISKILLALERHFQKNCVYNLCNDPSIISNSALVDFNDKDFDSVRFVKVNSMPAVAEHSTAKYYVDNAISNSVDES